MLAAAQLDTLSAEAQSVSLAAHCLVDGMKTSSLVSPSPADVRVDGFEGLSVLAFGPSW